MMSGSAWRSAALRVREGLRHPAGGGVLCPDSPRLARALACAVSSASGLIVELGAGTGAVTQALLDQGVDPRRLLVVARSAAFARHLLARFPCVRVMQGDMALLDRLLPAPGQVRAIVLGLQLHALSRDEAVAIMAQCHRLLSAHGVMVQFGHDLRAPDPAQLARAGFCCVDSRIVWNVLPPVRLLRWRKQVCR